MITMPFDEYAEYAETPSQRNVRLTAEAKSKLDNYLNTTTNTGTPKIHYI
jgi:hypothetical protein